MAILAMCVFGSCGKHEQAPIPKREVNESASPTSETKDKRPETTPGRLFQAILIPQPEPNHYQVRLSWQKLPPQAENWILQRRGSGREVRTLWRFDSDVLSVIDRDVEAGSKYRYLLSLSEDTAWHELDRVEVEIPRDTEIIGSQTTRGLTTHRLFFRPGSRLRTEGRDVTIRAGELIAERGTLESFPEGQTAAARADGRAGGNVSLILDSAIGLLTIIARGENAGAGIRGSTGAAGAAGQRGADATIELGDADLLHQITHDVHWIPFPGSLGTAPGVAKIESPKPPPPPDAPIWKAIYRCKTPPMPGATGASGGGGHDGGPGGRGGDSGNIRVTIASPSTVQIVPVFTPGRGGVGEGGEGGPGGPNGPPGNPDPYGVCPLPTIAAAPAKQGPPGHARAGQDGKKGTFCLQEKDGAVGECD